MIQYLEKIKSLKGKKSAGVELHLEDGDAMTSHVAILKQSGSNIRLIESASQLRSYQSISEIIPKSLPVCLSIGGKGMIYKKATINPNISLLQHLLPNAREDDFYVFHYPADNQKHFLAAIRKELLEKIISEFNNREFNIVYVELGPFALNQIMGSLEKNKDLKLNNYIISGESSIHDVQTTKEDHTGLTYQLGDETIKSSLLIALATGINFYTENLANIGFDPSIQGYKEYLYGRLFKSAGLGFLALLFILLLVNFIFFDHLNKRYNQLTFQLSQKSELITTLNNLKGELENKEQYIVDRGFLEPSRLSYYCDRIARRVPVSIELNRMRINPITGKLKTGEDVEMQKGVITIQGLSSDNIVLNSWIGSLKQMPWIQSIRLENYVRKKSNEPGLFSLIIKF